MIQLHKASVEIYIKKTRVLSMGEMLSIIHVHELSMHMINSSLSSGLYLSVQLMASGRELLAVTDAALQSLLAGGTTDSQEGLNLLCLTLL